MSESDYALRERDGAIARIRNAALLDAAFILVYHNTVMSTYPYIDQALLADIFDESEAAAALSTATKLLNSTYDLGKAYLAGRFTHEDCVKRLEAGFPGFGRESYEKALSYGCFQAR
ncbi:hypothetical protein J2792_002730 [Novosphingobium capsulatum]|uniref:Uncharacterized protein n=1 Tax=Novosphingobium capsulatum TaxID=13688 RepID=A0ABU1MNG3_9SPHN|nr:hypothetical protein [Novosphingobium capsulatum]MDR6511854.1 hypothetical protein [Novosphingobium capsulatum]